MGLIGGVYLAELQKGELRWGFVTYRSHVNADKKHIARMAGAVKRWKSMELTKHHARWRRSAASQIGAKRKIKTAAENLINRMVIHAWRKWSGTAKALVTTEGTMRAILVRVRLLKLTAAYNTWKGDRANEEAKRVVNVRALQGIEGMEDVGRLYDMEGKATEEVGCGLACTAQAERWAQFTPADKRF